MPLSTGLASSDRPRIVHVTTAHDADDVRIFERECRSLASAGYAVYLAANGQMPNASGVSLIPLAHAPVSRFGRFTSGPRKGLSLARIIQADLWHFHDPELLPVALKLSLSGHNVIWDAHEDYVAQFTPEGGKSWVPGPLRGAVKEGMSVMLHAVDRYAAAVVAATPAIASRYANPRTVVVGNEARLEDFRRCQPNFESRQIIFTGSVGPGHLFGEVVEAVRHLPSLTLAVAGRDPDPRAWAEARAALGSRLVNLGWLDRTGLCQAFEESSLGLCTYADLPPYAEAAPTKVYEFSAAGLPVVATPNRSNARILDASGGGFLAEGFTAENIETAITRALSKGEKWKRASERGRSWALQDGSWLSSEQRLLDLYKELLGS